MDRDLEKIGRALAIAVIAGCATLSAALAEPAPLPLPSGSPILTVEGDIEVANQDGKAVFDRQMLEALGTETIVTETPWYDGKVTFEGVPVSRLLERVGASGSTVTAVALNDYKVNIPTSDFDLYPAILALKRDGDYMPIEDKGPIFIVYPYDEYNELHAQKYYGRSVWQLSRMIVE